MRTGSNGSAYRADTVRTASPAHAANPAHAASPADSFRAASPADSVRAASGNADHAAVEQLHVLLLAVHVARDDGRIGGAVAAENDAGIAMPYEP